MPERKTTTPGYVNHPHGQVVIRNTGLPGNDHGQYVYQLGCSHCGHVYGANGSDIFERRCPECQGGRPGLPIK
jgi:PHP family Zn ribbon phosphoesterase